jgi:hypothetical protein
MEREALKLALEALERILGTFEKNGKVVMSSMIRNELFAEINLLLKKAKKTLAQPAQEPVAVHQFHLMYSADWHDGHPDPKDGHGPYETRTLYAAPPKHTLVGLTKEEVRQCGFAVPFDGAQDWALRFYKAIEAKLKEKNNG